MITEDYCNYKIAKLLKEKGFDVPSYKPGEWLFCMYDEEGKLQWGCYSDDWYCRVTIQMAMKWLREVHHFNISVSGITDSSCDADGNIVDEWQYWSYSIQSSLDFHYIYDDADQLNPNQFQTYEEACEAAIKYCLENLI